MSPARSTYLFALFLISVTCLNLLSVTAAPVSTASAMDKRENTVKFNAIHARDPMIDNIKLNMARDFRVDVQKLKATLPLLSLGHQSQMHKALQDFLVWFSRHTKADWLNPTDFIAEYDKLIDRIPELEDLNVYVVLMRRNILFSKLAKIAKLDGVPI